jgi:hypothetical protein|tara:strand:+ start:101 stop:1750 length:1650 start_codon:yes stop_codon:yes gene_type:complete
MELWLNVVAVLASLLFATLATATSLYNAVNHLRNYTQPAVQRHVVRILLIVPTYAVSSFLSFTFSPASLIFTTVRDVYEAYVIYCFLMLILAWAGGEELCIHKMSAKGALRHPPPMCCIVQSLNTRFLKQVKQGTIQFVVIKPIMAFISLVLLAFGVYDHPAWQWISGIIYNISYTVALYALFMLYLATKKCLKTYKPVRKFFAVKSIVFLTYWQSLAFQLIALVLPISFTVEDQMQWNSFVLSIEMFLFALLHVHSFPWWEFSLSKGKSTELLDEDEDEALGATLDADTIDFQSAERVVIGGSAGVAMGMEGGGGGGERGGVAVANPLAPARGVEAATAAAAVAAAVAGRRVTIDLEGGDGAVDFDDGGPAGHVAAAAASTSASRTQTRGRRFLSGVGMVVRNAVDVVNVRDIVADSVHSFAPKYSKYAGASLTEEAQSADGRESEAELYRDVHGDDGGQDIDEMTHFSSETMAVVLEAAPPPPKPQRDAPFASPAQASRVRATPGLSRALIGGSDGGGGGAAAPAAVQSVLDAASAALEETDEEELL